MRHNKTLTKIRLAFALIGLFLVLGPASAQQQQSQLAEAKPAMEAEPKANSASPNDSALNQIEQLRIQVEQLRLLVEQQQKLLLNLEQRLVEEKGSPGAVHDVATARTVSSSRQLEASDLTGSPVREAATSSTVAANEQQPTAQKATPVLAGWDGSHAFLRSADGSFETFLAGYAQLDFRGYQAGNHPANTFLIRRARVSIEGKLFRYFEYRVQGDLADTAGTILRDFYLRVHRDDRLQLTFGQFKEPFSQEELRADQDGDFVEKSLANNLAPSRSPGVMLSGALFKGAFEYQLGAFNGKGLLANNTVGTPEGALRVRFSPWKNKKEYWSSGLSFGGAYALGRNNTTLGIRGLTESRSFTYFNPDTVNGPITRANGELTWTVGPAALRAEYDQTNQARNHLGLNGSDLPSVVSKGFAGQFTYLLTGENKSEGGAVTPKHNVFGGESGKPGLGAWELKLRYSGLQISDRTAKSNRAQTIYFGANWYLNRFVRYMFDFGFEHYGDPLRTPRPGERNFKVVLSRVQLAF